MLASVTLGMLIGLGGVGTGRPPGAADEDVPSSRAPSSEDSGWTFSVTPYLWLYGIEGEVRIRDTSADFDVGFDDILENLDFAVMAHVEAWKGKLGLYFDPSYGALDVDAEAGTEDVDVETEVLFVDFGAFYRVIEHRDERGRARTADVSIGGRYMYFDNEIDFALAADRSRSDDFVDLTVGARYGMDLTERVGLLIEGDVGGFDLGSSSELAWNLSGLGSFRVGASGRIWAGYRVLDVDRDDGGSNGIDFRIHGPILGYEFRL